MPHTPARDVYAHSSMASVTLQGDTNYTLELSDAPNMSGLESNRDCTGGLGGGAEPHGFAPSPIPSRWPSTG